MSRPSTAGRAAPGCRRAFTLIEVLVALMIFALAAVVLGAAYLNVLNSYAAVAGRNNNTADVQFVRAALLTQPDPAQAAQGGTLPLPDGRQAQWTADIAETTVADLFSVTFHCRITGGDLRQPVAVDQSFMLLRPTWSDPAERSKLRAAAQTRITQMQQQTGMQP